MPTGVDRNGGWANAPSFRPPEGGPPSVPMLAANRTFRGDGLTCHTARLLNELYLNPPGPFGYASLTRYDGMSLA
jgi:hypothetical protein